MKKGRGDGGVKEEKIEGETKLRKKEREKERKKREKSHMKVSVSLIKPCGIERTYVAKASASYSCFLVRRFKKK